MYLHLYNVVFSDISSKAHNVPGGGLQDDVLVLAEGRDLEADLQRHLHVPEKHNLGLSTWCIKRLGSQLTVIHKKKKKNGQKWGNLRFYEAGSVQSLVLVHAAEASRVKFPPSFFFSTNGRRKGKIAICLTLLPFSRFYLSTLVDRAKSKNRRNEVKLCSSEFSLVGIILPDRSTMTSP